MMSYAILFWESQTLADRGRGWADNFEESSDFLGLAYPVPNSSARGHLENVDACLCVMQSTLRWTVAQERRPANARDGPLQGFKMNCSVAKWFLEWKCILKPGTEVQKMCKNLRKSHNHGVSENSAYLVLAISINTVFYLQISKKTRSGGPNAYRPPGYMRGGSSPLFGMYGWAVPPAQKAHEGKRSYVDDGDEDGEVRETLRRWIDAGSRAA